MLTNLQRVSKKRKMYCSGARYSSNQVNKPAIGDPDKSQYSRVVSATRGRVLRLREWIEGLDVKKERRLWIGKRGSFLLFQVRKTSTC